MLSSLEGEAAEEESKESMSSESRADRGLSEWATGRWELKAGGLEEGGRRGRILTRKKVSSRERRKQDERKTLALKAAEGVPRVGEPKPQRLCQGRKP